MRITGSNEKGDLIMKKIFGVLSGRCMSRALLLLLLIFGLAEGAPAAPPTFSVAFSPTTIGPGGVSTMTFTIDNTASVTPVSGLAFTNTLPAGMTIADPAGAVTTCTDAILSAPAAGGSISFSDGRLGDSASCTAVVNVTSSTPGTHVNTTGALSTSAGSSGTATANLVVDDGRPGFSMAFAPAVIAPGQVSTLTYTIDNSLNGSNADFLTMAHTLPVGLEVANPPNITIGCTGGALPAAVTAVAGSDNISFVFAYAAAGAGCAISVDLLATPLGIFETTTGELSQNGSNPSGVARAALSVERGLLTKTFTDDPVGPGDTVTLEYTLTNFERGNDATDIGFTDDLGGALAGLVATGLPGGSVCNGGSLSGTGVLTLSGASLGPGESCNFSVTLQVPPGAASGVYPGATGIPTADVGGVPKTFTVASDSLVVQTAPLLEMAFLNDPILPGEDVSLEFTVTNTDSALAASDIAFTVAVNDILPGTVVKTQPGANSCGAGSTFTASPLPGTAEPLFIIVEDANLIAGDSCTFTAVLTAPAGAPNGTYPYASNLITATVNGNPLTGKTATDDLVVVAPPVLSRSFTVDSVPPGNSVTLDYTLTHSPNAATDATSIAFDEDFSVALPGMTASALPSDGFCGGGAAFTGLGTGQVSMTGGSLAPGASCSFSITLDIPASATPATITSTTAGVTADVGGLSTAGNAVSDTLIISGLTLTKSIIGDPVAPGGTATFQYTIRNDSPDAAGNATDIQFADELSEALTGLAATALPANNSCGAGSTMTGTTSLTFSGGNLTFGDSCTFDVTVQVPGGAVEGDYNSTTSSVSATVGGNNTVSDPAVDMLTVGTPLTVTESFTDDPVFPGDTVTLEFTLENLHPTETMTNIAFTNDLDAALTGLEAVGPSADDICGTGSTLSGTDTITLSGGTLLPATSCTFAVTLQVPAGSTGTYPNVIANIAGEQGGIPFSKSDAPTDTLIVALAPAPGQMSITQSFKTPSTAAGGKAELSFTIQNSDSAKTADNVSFTADLGNALSGLAASGLPLSDVCGTSSSVSGTGNLSFSARTMAPNSSCTFSVFLDVPAGASIGDYAVSTESLVAEFGGTTYAYPPASATLVVDAAPGVNPDPDPASLSVKFTSSGQSGSESSGPMTITAELSAVSTKDVTVPFTTSGSAAGGGTDFTITQTPVTIPAGTTTQTITVTPNDDELAEDDETVIVTMGSPTNAIKGTITVHTITITYNDGWDPDMPPAPNASFAEKMGLNLDALNLAANAFGELELSGPDLSEIPEEVKVKITQALQSTTQLLEFAMENVTQGTVTPGEALVVLSNVDDIFALIGTAAGKGGPVDSQSILNTLQLTSQLMTLAMGGGETTPDQFGTIVSMAANILGAFPSLLSHVEGEDRFNMAAAADDIVAVAISAAFSDSETGSEELTGVIDLIGDVVAALFSDNTISNNVDILKSGVSLITKALDALPVIGPNSTTFVAQLQGEAGSIISTILSNLLKNEVPFSDRRRRYAGEERAASSVLTEKIDLLTREVAGIINPFLEKSIPVNEVLMKSTVDILDAVMDAVIDSLAKSWGIEDAGFSSSENVAAQSITTAMAENPGFLKDILEIACVDITGAMDRTKLLDQIISAGQGEFADNAPTIEKALPVLGDPDNVILEKSLFAAYDGIESALEDALEGTSVSTSSLAGVIKISIDANDNLRSDFHLMITSVYAVSSKLGQGIYWLPDGQLLMIYNNIAISAAPAFRDPLSLINELVNLGIDLTIIKDGRWITDFGNDAPLVTGMIGLGEEILSADAEPENPVAFTGPGENPATRGYAFQVIFQGAFAQVLPPALHGLDRLMESLGQTRTSYSIDRNTGVITLMDSLAFKPDYMMNPLNADEQLYWEENKASNNLAWKSGDFNEDGLMDFEMFTSEGRQIIYQLKPE